MGAVAIPLLLATLAALVSALVALSDHGQRSAVRAHRVSALEAAVRAQASSVARIESTAVAMRVDQARFTGAVLARVKSLEAHHD